MRTMTKEIWNGTVNEASGAITSESARQAVSEYQENGGGPLTLVLKKGDEQDEISYFVLSRETALEIEQQLTMWEAEKSSFMRHIGRAFVFDEAGLYEGAAREYEAALADAPQGRDLMLATIREYEHSGDEHSAKAVRDRLSSH
jgi:hypothetical protein